MRSISSPAIAALSLLILSSHAQEFTTPVDPSFSPCPQPVGVKNGGFESGSIAPWTTETDVTNPFPVAGSITSPGCQSKYAWEVSFQPGTIGVEWTIAQDIGQVCEGMAYEVTFAVNIKWLALQGEPDKDSNICIIGMSPNYCYERYSDPGYYNASTKPGWVRYSYTCRSQKTGSGELIANFECKEKYTLPAITLQIDDISVELAKDQKASVTSVEVSVPATTSPDGGESSGVATTGNSTAVLETTTVTAGASGTASGSEIGASASTLPSGGAPVPTIATAIAGRARGGDFLEGLLRSGLVLGLVLGPILVVRW